MTSGSATGARTTRGARRTSGSRARRSDSFKPRSPRRGSRRLVCSSRVARLWLGHDDGVAAAGLLYTAPTLGSTAAARFYAMSIAAARKTLYITNLYFAPDRSFIELLTAAARRGVDVRILTAGARTDVQTVRLAGRAWDQTLLGAGVRVFEWQPTTLHAKTFVVDGMWVTIGSMNFDNRSLALNDEATLMVLDQNVGQRMDAIFLDDLRDSEDITPDRFRQRSWLQRIAEATANLFTRIL